MLSKNEIERLNKCMINNHALISLDSATITAEGLAVRHKVNSGEAISYDELMKLPTSSSLIEIEILDENILHSLVELCISIGSDLQSLFETKSYSYLSLFIEPADMRIQHFFLYQIKELYPAFWQCWKDNEVDDITVSFPEKEIE
ncbi:hypothetical protein F1K17_09765 [Salmonella enterica subsp. enterica]|nr:hypothetical protein [Salmonella enterica subsp. enterica]